MAEINYAEIARLVRKGRRAERRGAAASGCITALLNGALLALVGGWELMLGVGVIHAEWIRQLPTVGYWWAVLIVYLLRGVFSRVPQQKSEERANG